MQQNIIILVQIFAVLLKIGCINSGENSNIKLQDVPPSANMKFLTEDHRHFFPDEPPPPPDPSLRHGNDLNLEEEGFIPIQEQVREIKIHRRHKRAVTALKHRLWPNATVPYVISPNTSETVKLNILAAMAHWEEYTCIKFVPWTKEKDYIEIAPGRCGCCSYVGRQTDRGRQFVNISENCGVFGVIVHELGHTIGFWHEHSRPDRDKYIRIIMTNIKPGRLENFYKKSDMEIDSLGQPYDYSSIMHYRKTTFSSNGRNTMEPLVERVYIGQRVSLSKGDVAQANLLYNCPKPNCNLEFHESKGNFSTPNYPMYYYKEHKCTWIVHTPKGHSLQLVFEDFQLEKSDNCTFDYIELRLGTSKKGKPIGRLCGLGHPGELKVWGSLWVHFSSDSSIMLRGFKVSFLIAPDDINLGDPLMMADDPVPEVSGSGSGEEMRTDFEPKHRFEYKTDCHRTLTAIQGTIKSPLALAMSPLAVECRWTISGGPHASAIYLKLDTSFSRVEGESCVGVIQKRTKFQKKFNMPDAFDGQGIDVESYDPHPYDCSTPNGDKIQLNTTEAVIMWSSKYHRGFKLSYIIDYNECRINKSLCDHKCVNTITGYRCICQSGFKPDKKQVNCLPKRIEYVDTCNKTLTNIRGKIHLSNSKSEECGFEVDLEPHHRIFLTFPQFNIPYSENCTKHYMMVYTGSEHHTKGRFCGTTSPGVLTTPNGYIAIRVHLEPSVLPHLPYFTASYIAHQTYEKEACFFRLRGGGNFTSPKWPSKYPTHSLCIWKLTVHGDHVVKLQFTSFDVEKTKLCHYDYVEVRDGRRRTSPFIGRFCGKDIPKDVYATGKHMWVMFISDESHSGRGFSAEFSPHKLNGTDATGRHGNHQHPRRRQEKDTEEESDEQTDNVDAVTNSSDSSTVVKTSTVRADVTRPTVTMSTETEGPQGTVAGNKIYGTEANTGNVATVTAETTTASMVRRADAVVTEDVDIVEVEQTITGRRHGSVTNSDLTVGITVDEDTPDRTQSSGSGDSQSGDNSQFTGDVTVGSGNKGVGHPWPLPGHSVEGETAVVEEDISESSGSSQNILSLFEDKQGVRTRGGYVGSRRGSTDITGRDIIRKKSERGRSKNRRKGRRRGRVRGSKNKGGRGSRSRGHGGQGENEIDRDSIIGGEENV